MALKISLFLFILSIHSVWSQTGPLSPELQKENAKLMKAIDAGDEIDASKYSDELKDYYWKNYKTKSDKILKTEKINDNLKTQQDELSTAKEPLTELEHNEDETDKIEEKVAAHVKLLNDKVYQTNKFVLMDYITWQREANIKSSAGVKTPLIITAHGGCAGGGWGHKNAFYHAFIDGCFAYGYGNVGAEVNSLTYKQSNIPVYGLKASIGAGMIVSSLGAEVGLKLPVFYNQLELDKPNQSQFPGYKVDEETPFLPMASLYSKWPVQRWFFQTEFAKVIGQDLTFWGLGIGYTL